MPKVNVEPEYVKSFVGLWKTPLIKTKNWSTVFPLDTVKPVVEPSPVKALTTGLSLKVF